jgi:hypothetical protein
MLTAILIAAGAFAVVAIACTIAAIKVEPRKNAGATLE